MRQLTLTGAYISNRIGRAIADYRLIEDGDKILVAVSGGKDSLTLLKLLGERRRWAPVRYDLLAFHVESDYRCASCAHVDTLRGVFREMGVSYRFGKMKILGTRHGDSRGPGGPHRRGRKVSCFWCSWNRRKALFTAADKYGCNKVAFGHHKDDIIETLLLNMVYNGEFSAMNPRQELFGGKLTIIRPLCYVDEKYTRAFSEESSFPTNICRCPNSQTSKRRMMKNMVRALEKGCPYVKTNIMRSIARCNKDYTNIKECADEPYGS